MRRVLWWLTVVALAPIVVAVVARAFRLESGPLVILVAFMPWVTFACIIPFVLALMARSLTLAAAAAVIAALCAWWMLPLFTFEGGGTPVLTVASINSTNGSADAAGIVAMVRENDVGVLAVQELTASEVSALNAAGLGTLLPASYVRPADGVNGIGLWSKYPMTATALDGFTANAIQATVATPSGDLKVIAVHPASPGVRDHTQWSKDLAQLDFVLTSQIGPTMAVGDFNATRDHAPFRAIEGQGYVDAADQAGAGFAPTFPEGRTPLPLVAIDHVVARDGGLKARSFETYSIAGADHRAIIVEYGTSG